MAYWYEENKSCKHCGDEVYEIGETYYCQTCMKYLNASELEESKSSIDSEWDKYIQSGGIDLDTQYDKDEEDIEVITIDKNTLPMHGMLVVLTEMEESELKLKAETCLGAKVNFISEPLSPLIAQFFDEKEGILIGGQLGLSRSVLEYRLDISIPTTSEEDRKKAVLAMREISPAFVFREDCSKRIIVSNKGIGNYIAKGRNEVELLSSLLTLEAKTQIMLNAGEQEVIKDIKWEDVYLSVNSNKGTLVELKTLENWEGMSHKLKEFIDDCEETCITTSPSDKGVVYTIAELVENSIGTLEELEELEQVSIACLKMEVSV